MFDIGFTELLLIGVVALVVVGPERLPSLIRTTLSYIRQFKSGFAHIRDEVEREMRLDELKDDLTDSKDEVSKVIGYDELHQSLDELKKESESLREIAGDGYEYADDFHDDHVSDAEIEADLDGLVGPTQLPDPNSEADTGIEEMKPQTKKDKKTAQKVSAKTADKAKSDKKKTKPKADKKTGKKNKKSKQSKKSNQLKSANDT